MQAYELALCKDKLERVLMETCIMDGKGMIYSL